MASDTRVFTAHIPTALAEKVDGLAGRLDRPRGWIVKQALTDWVAREDEYQRLTLEGLADIEAGRIVSQEEMEAWADSLPEE